LLLRDRQCHHAALRGTGHGYTMGIHEWLAREKQERAVRVERPPEDVCRRVSLRRACMIDSARCEAIDQQYDVAPRHCALRRTLNHSFGQSGAAMKCDDRRKWSVPFRFGARKPRTRSPGTPFGTSPPSRARRCCELSRARGAPSNSTSLGDAAKALPHGASPAQQSMSPIAAEHTLDGGLGVFTLTAPETTLLQHNLAARAVAVVTVTSSCNATAVHRPTVSPNLEDRPEQRRDNRDQPRKAQPFLQDNCHQWQVARLRSNHTM